MKQNFAWGSTAREVGYLNVPPPSSQKWLIMIVLVDTNALFALANADDENHDQVKEYVESTDDVLLLPITVLPEIDYLVTKHLGVQVEIALLRDIAAGAFRLETMSDDDVIRATDLVEQYSDSDIGFVDASIVAIAERLNVTRILTGDQHFRMIRPRHCAYFELVP